MTVTSWTLGSLLPLTELPQHPRLPTKKLGTGASTSGRAKRVPLYEAEGGDEDGGTRGTALGARQSRRWHVALTPRPPGRRARAIAEAEMSETMTAPDYLSAGAPAHHESDTAVFIMGGPF